MFLSVTLNQFYLLAKSDLCYAFSKDVPDSVIGQYQKALDAVEADGDLKKIQDKYIK